MVAQVAVSVSVHCQGFGSFGTGGIPSHREGLLLTTRMCAWKPQGWVLHSSFAPICPKGWGRNEC